MTAIAATDVSSLWTEQNASGKPAQEQYNGYVIQGDVARWALLKNPELKTKNL